MKCSRYKTSRPRKLKSSHGVDLMRSTWCELFSLLCLIVLDLEHLNVLGGLVFVCSPLIHTLWSALYFFVYTTLTLLKSLKWMSLGNFTKIQGKPKSLRRQWKVWIIYGNHPCLQHFSDCLLTLLTCRKDWTLFKWYINIPHIDEIFWKIKELSGQSENFPDILESFHTIWKLSRHSGNFPDNMESVHTIRKVYRQPVNFLDNQ